MKGIKHCITWLSWLWVFWCKPELLESFSAFVCEKQLNLFLDQLFSFETYVKLHSVTITEDFLWLLHSKPRIMHEKNYFVRGVVRLGWKGKREQPN